MEYSNFENGKIVVKREDGTTISGDVLIEMESDETNQSYVVYTDYSRDDKGNIRIFVNTYDPTGEDPTLGCVTSQKELNVVQSIMDELKINVSEMIKASREEDGSVNNG